MAAIEADHVGLEPVPEPGLGDAGAPLEVVDQHVEPVSELVVELVDTWAPTMPARGCPPKPGAGSVGSHSAERHPPGRGDWRACDGSPVRPAAQGGR